MNDAFPNLDPDAIMDMMHMVKARERRYVHMSVGLRMSDAEREGYRHRILELQELHSTLWGMWLQPHRHAPPHSLWERVKRLARSMVSHVRD